MPVLGQPMIEIIILGSGPAAEAVVNTFHYQKTNSIAATYADVQALVQAFRTGLYSSFQACVTSDWDGLIIRGVMKANVAGDLWEVEIDITGDHGLAAAGAMPITDCIIVRKLTGIVGRKNRGRIYVSPVSDGLIDIDGSVDTGALPAVFNSLAAAMSAIISDGVTDWNPVVCDAAYTHAAQVTEGTISTTMGLQRSRRIRNPN